MMGVYTCICKLIYFNPYGLAFNDIDQLPVMVVIHVWYAHADIALLHVIQSNIHVIQTGQKAVRINYSKHYCITFFTS